jgi:hypothetical protein
MKTQIIQLEPHDDHISIRDKMNWSKTPRILLVFPRRKRFDLDTLDLKLLQRHAHSLGAELGLVTKSLKVIRSAEALGIPTFADNLAAQHGVWLPQKHKKTKRRLTRPNLREMREEIHPQEAKWREHIAVRLGALLFAGLALLALLIAFIPSARITLRPERKEQNITIPVRASNEVQEVFITGSLPAHTLRVVLTEKSALVATGQVAIPSRGASGLVIFRNLTDQLIRIPKGTVVRSIDDPSIRFETDFEALVNPGVDEDIEVPVSALSFGEGGNLDMNLLQAIEGELRFSLAATNPAPTTGGGDEIVRVPSLRDREDLREQMLFNLTANPEKLVDEELGENDLLFPDTLGEIEVLEEIYTPDEGEPADRITLEMQVAIDAQYATAADLETLARSALAANLPQGYVPEANSFSYEPLGDLETDTLGVTTFQMRVAQSIVPNIAQTQITNLLQGKRVENAAKILAAELTLENMPKIEISPAWWRWLPIAPFRIEVIVE